MKQSLTLIALALGFACTQGPIETEPVAPAEVIDTVEGEFCQTAVFKVDADFSAANMASCAIVDARTVEIFLKPENTPINASPWYAVRLTPEQPGNVRVILRYEEHPHRYKPKVSLDGQSWSVVPDAMVDERGAGYRISIKLDLDDVPMFLSAQELFTNGAHNAWIDALAEKPFLEVREIGQSVEGRPIRLLTSSAQVETPKTVMLVGRQHPPEVTGALAMISFTEEVLGDSVLARRFRSEFDLEIIPNLNPDGVEHGHWRHNFHGVDLNRDWGPFTQPETQAAKSVIDQIEAPGLALFLDFHSTRRNVFYTQRVGNDGTEYGFTAEWLKRARQNTPDYEFGREGAHNVDLPTSKTYIYERFNIPAITYELGDETDRTEIAQTARVFAREMMTLLLEQE